MSTRKVSFSIPGRLEGLNEYINACRTNPYKGNLMKKKAQDRVVAAIECCEDKVSEPLKNPARIFFTFFEPTKRRDVDNISGFAHKVILDGLVESRVLQDDGWKYVVGIHDTFLHYKEPEIRVEVWEDDGEDCRD